MHLIIFVFLICLVLLCSCIAGVYSTARGFFSISLASEWVIKLSGRIKKFLPLFDSTHFSENTAMKTQVFFSGALSGIAEG